MRVTWSDDLDRVLAVEEKPTAGEKYFFHRLDGFLGKRAAHRRRARGRAAAACVDQLRHAPLVVVPRERRQKEYRGARLLREPARARWPRCASGCSRAQAMDSGFTWGGAVTDSLEIPRGTFGVYWYDRGPTTPEGMEKAIAEFQRTGDFDALQYLTRKELYRRTGETRFLVAQPEPRRPARAGAPRRHRGRRGAQQGRLQHGLLLRRRRGLAHVVRRSRRLQLGRAHAGRLPRLAARPYTGRSTR